jgi:hypothetical protein
MRVATSDGKTFTLECENDADHELVNAIDSVRHVTAVKTHRTPYEHGGWINTGYTLLVDRDDPQKLVAETGRQALRSLGDLLRIGLREAALDRHVRANAADPQAQDPLATVFVQLQDVLQVLARVVGQREFVRQEVARAHSGSSHAIEGSTVAPAGTPL